MNILFCSRRFFPAISGMSVYAANLLAELVAGGHQVTMVSQHREDEAGTRIYGGGPPPAVSGVHVIGRRSRGEEACASPGGADFERDIDDMVTTIIAEHQRQPFDVLHAQYGYPNGWAILLAARVIRVPTVVSIQGGDGHWVGDCCETHRLAMQRVLEGANAVLIGCESFAAEVRQRLGTSRTLTIVPGAVDVLRFAPTQTLGSARTPPRLLYHGRVDRRKGVLDFLQALMLLRASNVPFHGIVSGIGPDLDTAQALATPLGEAVAFTGHADYESAPSVYAHGDIFVSPTYAEGFSNTVLEAMSSGLPCVSCHAVGIVDCLRDGDNGLLVSPGDVPALADAVRRLIENKSLRRRLAETALAECRARYSWRTVAGQIVDTYERVRHQPPGIVDPTLPIDRACRFRAAPHLL